MIGLVLVSHGDFSEALLRATEHVVGPLGQAAAITIGPDDDMEAKRAAIAAAVENCDTGDGVIVAADMFGGTPSNLAISLMKKKVEVVAGANLPMLIRFEGARHKPLAECAEALRDAGRKYISVASEILGQPDSDQAPRPVSPREDEIQAASEALQDVADDLNRLSSALRSSHFRQSTYGQIGHNLAPAFSLEDRDLLADGEAAARVAAGELDSGQPRQDVLRLCISAMKRVLKLLKELTHWVFSKGDLFLNEAIKSAGKAVGPAVVISATIAQLTGELSQLIEKLRTFAGL